MGGRQTSSPGSGPRLGLIRELWVAKTPAAPGIARNRGRQTRRESKAKGRIGILDPKPVMGSFFTEGFTFPTHPT